MGAKLEGRKANGGDSVPVFARNEYRVKRESGYGVFFGTAAESCLKDIRFCGKEWLMERCEKRVAKPGY